VWSPDGKRLCFAAKDPQNARQGVNLYAVALDDKRVHTLTARPGDELECRWSPDGTKVAYVWFPRGFAKLEAGTAALRITDLKTDDYVLVDGFAWIGYLSWKPDGTQLAYITRSASQQLYIVDVMDGSAKSLTEQYEMASLAFATWSPNGKWIAFQAQGPKGRGIYTITPDGEELSQIVFSPSDDWGLTWSPDGNSIAFTRGSAGSKLRIWIVQVEKGKLEELKIP